MKETNNLIYRISITDNIYELDLKYLIRLMNIEGSLSLVFKNNYIFYYDMILSKEFDKNKNLIIHEVVNQVYYAKVKEFKKFVIFDDIFDIFEYTNDITELSCKGESTKIITISDIRDRIIDEIYSKLLNVETID